MLVVQSVSVSVYIDVVDVSLCLVGSYIVMELFYLTSFYEFSFHL
jgi:hypothetical protein